MHYYLRAAREALSAASAAIADEALCSQADKSSIKLKQLLRAGELAEGQDSCEIDTETLLVAEMLAKASQDKRLACIALPPR